MVSAARILAVGLVTLLGQVVLLREMGVVAFGSELAYTLGLGIWLVGAAIGAGRRTTSTGPGAASALVVAAGWAVVPAVVLARGIRPLFGAVTGADLDLARQFVGLALVLGPVGFLGGAAFRAVAAAREAQGGLLARTYALESLGAVVGGLVATLLPVLGVPGLGGAWLAALAASLAWLPDRRTRGLVLAAVALLGFALAPIADIALTRWTHPALLATRDTPYGRVTIDGHGDQVAVFIDDALAYENQGTVAEEYAALVALQRPQPGNVLVMGGWVEGLAGEIDAYRPRRVVSLEIDGELLELAAPYLPNRPAPADVVIGDPRRIVARLGRFDLIVSALPEPSTGQANRNTTAEFFSLCAAALDSGGVYALRLHTAENLWTPRQAHRAAAIDAALRTVFTDVLVLPGTETVFLASRVPLQRDPAILATRLRAAHPATRLVSPAWLDWRYTNDRTHQVADLLHDAQVPANRDRRPTCYADTLLLDLARFFPGLGWRAPPAAGRWLWLALIVLLVPAVLARRSAAGRRTWLAAYAGLAGLSLEIVLILNDQTVRGLLYRDLGLLLTLFMLGLAAGARLGEAYGRRPASPWRRPGLVAAVSLWSFLLAFALLAAEGGLVVSATELVVTGLLTGLLFAAAAARTGNQVGGVYAADLIGGAIGCLLTSLFLVPFAGLPAACVAVAVLAFAAAMAVWPGSYGPGTS